MVKSLPAMWETWVQSLGWEDPLEEGVATHSSVLAWRIPTGGLRLMGSQRVRHEWDEEQHSTSAFNTGSSTQCSVVFQSLSPARLCNPKDCSTPDFAVLHQFWEFAQTHVCWVSDAIQPSHPLSLHSPPALNLSQHQGFFQWVISSHPVSKYWRWLILCDGLYMGKESKKEWVCGCMCITELLGCTPETNTF